MTKLLSALFYVTSGWTQVYQMSSELDQTLTLQCVVFLGVFDNLSGILAGPLEDHFKHDLKNLPQIRFEYQKVSKNPVILSEKEKSRLIPTGCNGGLWAQVFQQERFLKTDWQLFESSGKILLISEALFEGPPHLSNLQGVMSDLLRKLWSQLPFQGWVISRREQDVTINLGSRQGLKAYQMVDVILISKVDRHPLRQFITKYYTDIIGRILITQVEENMSFGVITEERFEQAIRKGAKVFTQPPVRYPVLERSQPSQNSGIQVFQLGREDTFEPRIPEYGFIQWDLSSSMVSNNQTQVGRNLVSGKNDFILGGRFLGEIWITENYSAHVGLALKSGHLKLQGPGVFDSTPAISQRTEIGFSWKSFFPDAETQSYLVLQPKYLLGRWDFGSGPTNDLTGMNWNILAIGIGLRFIPETPFAIQGTLDWGIQNRGQEVGTPSGLLENLTWGRVQLGAEFFYHPLQSFLIGLEQEWFNMTIKTSPNSLRTYPVTESRLQDLTINAGIRVYF